MTLDEVDGYGVGALLMGWLLASFDGGYFESNYRDYEGQNPPAKLDHYLTSIRQRWTPREQTTFLDVGCGLGLWAQHVAHREPDWNVHAMDVDADVVALNATRFPQVRFIAGRAGEGSPAAHYDVVTAMDVLEHIPDVERRFADTLDWLRPGGLVVFVVPVYDGPLGPLVHLLDSDPTHIHKWGRRRWLALARDRLDDIEWHGLFRLMLPWGHYVHFSSRLLRWVAPAILVSGRVPSAN